ncbi:MAG TPA: DUF2480 family protein [Bacteroidia bacterium]|nr:DUF2480 family protein [Bacteroidia bacterium]
MEAIFNKVDASGLVTVNLEELIPEGERVLLDIRPWLFEDLILKEKDFRDHIRQHDWNQYAHKFVALTCTSDAIIPVWAWMLIEVALEPYAERVLFGTLNHLEEALLLEKISALDAENFRDARIVIKGCGDKAVSPAAYAAITHKLASVAKSIMYGEPCSTVPVMKRK